MKNHWFFPFLSRYVVSLILVYADGGGGESKNLKIKYIQLM